MISYAICVLVAFLCTGFLIVFVRALYAAVDFLYDEDMEDE